MIHQHMPDLCIVSDHWNGVFNDEEVVNAPTLADFDLLLNRMDARTYTLLTLRREGNVHMCIGGGDPKYIVYATFDNEIFWNLITPKQVMAKIIVVNAGGQEGEYAARQVVAQDLARRAGHTFMSTGELDGSLQWETQ